MFINNKFRRFVITCLSVCAVGIVSAGAASVDTKAELDSVAAQMNTYKAYMDNAHSHAETVRSTGADDEHEVIQSAKVLWNDANETYTKLVAQYNVLNTKYKAEVAAEKKAAEEAKKKQEQNSKGTLIGKYRITFYCPCYICNGRSDGLTAIGTYLTVGDSIAVNPSEIPLGSKVYIDGIGWRTAVDTGAFGSNTIDVLVSSHSEAYRLGVQYHNVYVKK